MSARARRRTYLGGLLLTLGALGPACQREPVGRDAPASGSRTPGRPALVVEPSPAARPADRTPPSVALQVTGVRADPSVDAAALQAWLRSAETGLLVCLDPDQSTGALILRFLLEPDGSIGELGEAAGSSYGTEEARTCIERLLGAMRYPVAVEGRPAVEVTFEVAAARGASPP